MCVNISVSCMGGSQRVNVGDLHSASSLFPVSLRCVVTPQHLAQQGGAKQSCSVP